MTDDLIGRAEAQTAIQFAAKRYMVAHEAHGEGQVVWSDNLINVTDAMNVLRDLPPAQPEPEAISEWKKEFREYVDSLDIARDDWKGIIEYIDELPSAQLGTNLAEVGTDLVSRQAVKDIFTELYGISAIGSVFDKYEWADICETTANELPSAQPERIKGHWIAITSWNNTYKCSVCGRLLVNITDGKNKVAKNYPYCHCGADMRPTERNMGKEQRNIRGKRENRNDKTRAVR